MHILFWPFDVLFVYLPAAAMKIIPLSIPTPFYVGDVNVYLVKEDPVTIIDVGPKTDEAAQALRHRLGEHGLSFSDIRRIVLTHAHEDHCGLAKRVRDEASDAEVYIHGWETGHLFGRLARDAHREHMARAGVPAKVFEEMRTVYEQISLLTDSLEGTEYSTLRDGGEIDFETGVLRVLHTPGHTPGSCSFVREADRTIISGDCVLKRITPNPVVSPDPVDPARRFRSLAEYLVSLARIRSLAPTLVYGGHGEPIWDFEEIFHRYVRAIDERQKKVVGLVTSTGVTAWEVARRMFPEAVGKEVHRFLAVSESIAHLDYAVSEGRISIETGDGVEFYKKAGSGPAGNPGRLLRN